MKIGVIADIHGNQYAFNEVLKSATALGIRKLLVLGDIVGYYYRPEVILEALSEWSYEIIKGNHEDILKALYENKIDSKSLKEKYGSGHEMALKNIDDEKLKWLFSLPSQKDVVIDGVSFQLNHGSPNNIDEYIYPDASIEKLDECNSDVHDFVLIGHSHYSFIHKCKNSILINCGSVGQSRQKGGVANWAIINTSDKSYEIIHTPYNTAHLIKDVKLIDPENEYSYKVLER
ncbi:MAG: metallophosphoesterase [Chitinophagaceae bacterium]|nr:MAG: metallophosphoesterase [Chitinophagaceae bacterium]